MRQGNGSTVTKTLPSADTKGRWGSCRPPGAGQGSPQPLHLIPSRAGGQRPRNSEGIPGRRSRLSPAGSAARPLWADDPNRPPPPRRAGRSPRSPARGEEREGGTRATPERAGGGKGPPAAARLGRGPAETLVVPDTHERPRPRAYPYLPPRLRPASTPGPPPR